MPRKRTVYIDDVVKGRVLLERAAQRAALSFDEVVVLLRLRDNRRESASVLARQLGMSRPKITRCTADLVVRGLMEDTPDLADLRKCVFRLTNRGENASFELMRALDAHEVESALKVISAWHRAVQAMHAPVSGYALCVLACLGADTEPCSVGHVAQRCKFAHNTASTCIQSLVKHNFLALVQRAEQEENLLKKDGRTHWYAITEEGSKLSDELGRLYKQYHK